MPGDSSVYCMVSYCLTCLFGLGLASTTMCHYVTKLLQSPLPLPLFANGKWFNLSSSRAPEQSWNMEEMHPGGCAPLTRSFVTWSMTAAAAAATAASAISYR